MTITIDKSIVDFNVVKNNEDGQTQSKAKEQNIDEMSEKISRPELLTGETYKIKPPTSEHALYVTINDIVLNQGTEHEIRRPFEVFLNSKNMEHYQWTIALTLIISAIFRKGGDINFLVDELRSVFDPNGGYMKKGGKYMPSLVSEIGDVIEKHLKRIGMLEEDADDELKQQALAQKKHKLDQKQTANDDQSGFPAHSKLCNQCSTKAMIMMDGCLTCLNCGHSKCG